MLKYFRFFVSTLLLLAPLFAWSAEQPSPAAVEEILFDRDPEAEYVRIRLSSRVEPVVFQLPGENPRVVCDLPAVSYPPAMKRVLPAGGDLLRRIRVGVHHKPEPKTRIVIDLMGEGEYDVVHEFVDGSSVLSIRIAPKTTKMKSDVVPPDTGGSKEEFTTLDTDTAPSQSPLSVEEDAESVVPATPEPEEPAAAARLEKTENEPESGPAELPQRQSTLELGGDGQDDGSVGEDELPVLLDITYETSTNDKEMVLFRLSGFHPPVVFSTEGDNLLVVCDFLDAMLGYGIDPVLRTDGKYIQEVRTDKLSDPDKVRVVLDLVEGYNYDVKQVFFKDDNLFVVVITRIFHEK